MAGKTNTEKIDELYRLVYSLLERVDDIEEDIAVIPALVTRVAILEHQLSDLKNSMEQQFADLKKSLETLTTRLWQIGISLGVAVVGALLTALLRK